MVLSSPIIHTQLFSGLIFLVSSVHIPYSLGELDSCVSWNVTLHWKCSTLYFCLCNCRLSIVRTVPKSFPLPSMGGLIQSWELPFFCRGWFRKLSLAQSWPTRCKGNFPVKTLSFPWGDCSSALLGRGCVWLWCLNYGHPSKGANEDGGWRREEGVGRTWWTAWSYSCWAWCPFYL